MMQWRIPDTPDEAKLAWIKSEIEAIFKHLGPEAPHPSTEITIQVNKDGMIQFITPTELFVLARDTAIRYRPSRDGNEDATYRRDGVQVRHIVNPLRGNRIRYHGGSP